MSNEQLYRWLIASILVAVLFSLSGFGLSLEPYTIQDDARQYIPWLQRFNDPNLFPNDAIADYFTAVTPAGYKLLYWIANLLGIEPLTFNKILPLLLGVGNSVFCYLVTLEMFPVPLAGFISSLLLNQNLWLLDDLVSGTPRAFFYVLFLGFIYYFLRRQLLPCLLVILLQSLFYPQTVLISAGILSLDLITRKKPYFQAIALITALLTLTIYKLQTGEYTQILTIETARKLPEFAPGGRSEFFLHNSWYFWLSARRSGFFPFEWQYFNLCAWGLLLPVITKFPQFSLARQLNAKATVIGQIILTSFGLFCLSHLTLFRLHLPSRYSQHSWRIVIALMAGITLTILLNWLFNRIALTGIARWISMAIAILILLYPTYAVQSYNYRLGYMTGKAPALYQFLQQQPPDITIATLSSEADFIPSFARRSVLVSAEYSIPYHWDYYARMRRRTRDLISAQYSLEPLELQQFIRKYQVDFWLLDRQAFQINYLQNNPWINDRSETKQAIALLQQSRPAIADYIDRCSVFQMSELSLLDTQCMLKK